MEKKNISFKDTFETYIYIYIYILCKKKKKKKKKLCNLDYKSTHPPYKNITNDKEDSPGIW